MSRIMDVPALAPPSGVQPNFVDPYSLNPAFVVTTVLCLLLTTSAVMVRLAVSLCGSTKRLRVEDYTSVVSWLGLIATCVLTTFEIRDGLGRHQWDVPKANIVSLSRILYINRVCYSPTILAAKVTVLVQLMRIFVPLKRGLVYRIIQTLIWLNISFYLANVLSVILQCSPVPKAWNASIQGHCVNTNLNLIVTGTINVISDVLILLLPLWTIWHLKLPIQKKLSVSAAFAAGIFANVAGIYRLVYSIRILHGSDLTYLRLQHGMWTIAEISTVIICASLPLAPKFWKFFQNKRPPLISSGPGYSRPGHSRRYSHLDEESELRPTRFTPEPIDWGDGSRGGADTSRQGKQVVVAGAYVPADDESAVAALQGSEKGIRKTVRIEQSC